MDLESPLTSPVIHKSRATLTQSCNRADNSGTWSESTISGAFAVPEGRPTSVWLRKRDYNGAARTNLLLNSARTSNSSPCLPYCYGGNQRAIWHQKHSWKTDPTTPPPDKPRQSPVEDRDQEALLLPPGLSDEQDPEERDTHHKRKKKNKKHKKKKKQRSKDDLGAATDGEAVSLQSRKSNKKKQSKQKKQRQKQKRLRAYATTAEDYSSVRTPVTDETDAHNESHVEFDIVSPSSSSSSSGIMRSDDTVMTMAAKEKKRNSGKRRLRADRIDISENQWSQEILQPAKSENTITILQHAAVRLAVFDPVCDVVFDPIRGATNSHPFNHFNTNAETDESDTSTAFAPPQSTDDDGSLIGYPMRTPPRVRLIEQKRARIGHQSPPMSEDDQERDEEGLSAGTSAVFPDPYPLVIKNTTSFKSRGTRNRSASWMLREYYDEEADSRLKKTDSGRVLRPTRPRAMSGRASNEQIQSSPSTSSALPLPPRRKLTAIPDPRRKADFSEPKAVDHSAVQETQSSPPKESSVSTSATNPTTASRIFGSDTTIPVHVPASQSIAAKQAVFMTPPSSPSRRPKRQSPVRPAPRREISEKDKDGSVTKGSPLKYSLASFRAVSPETGGRITPDSQISHGLKARRRMTGTTVVAQALRADLEEAAAMRRLREYEGQQHQQQQQELQQSPVDDVGTQCKGKGKEKSVKAEQSEDESGDWVAQPLEFDRPDTASNIWLSNDRTHVKAATLAKIIEEAILYSLDEDNALDLPLEYELDSLIKEARELHQQQTEFAIKRSQSHEPKVAKGKKKGKRKRRGDSDIWRYASKLRRRTLTLETDDSSDEKYQEDGESDDSSMHPKKT
eukprot:TRINITY_DN1354_c1_g1_i2.p1 TRINITY_DN1354_c1_g1~~TRINITY_DN1354_c1_g1_i2.p1  ORF type:complete len:848 (-),score=171.82 TRINITY_DN1354_c1_g1_i2:2717-5260(-)